MRQVGATIVTASFLALGIAPAAARETPGFIVRGAPITAPRGYIDMCNAERGPLCDGERIAVAPQSGSEPAWAPVPVAGDATGGIAMPDASPVTIELTIRCPVGTIAGAAFSARSPDLTLQRVLLPAQLESPSLSAFSFAPRLAAWQTMPSTGPAHRDCAVPARAPNPRPALTMLDARLTRQDGFLSGSTIANLRLPVRDSYGASAVYQTPLPAPEIALRAAPPRSALKALRSVNRFVNQRVIQRTDLQIYGRGEVWHRSGTGKGAQGDCEDLAIEKRLELIARGFPADRLFFAVVYRGDVGLHTVLISRLGDGDYVLDSLTPHIVPWSQAPYSWISVQAPARPSQWHSVRPIRDLIAAGKGRGTRDPEV